MSDTPLSSRRLFGTSAVLAVLIGSVYRIYLNSVYSFNGEEFYVLHLVTSDWATLLFEDIRFYPPLFYILSKFSVLTFGTSELSVRLPSLLAGIATLIVFYVILRRATTRRAADLALWFAAVNPALAWYSIHARSHSLSALLMALTIWVTLNYAQDKHWRHLAGLACLTWLAMFNHYATGLAVAALSGSAILWVGRAEFKKWFGWHVLAALCYTPWLYAYYQYAQGGPPSYERHSATAEFLAEILKTPFIYVIYKTLVAYDSQVWWQLTMGAVLAAVTGPPLVRELIHARRSPQSSAVTVLLLFCVPVATMIAIIPVVTLFDPKYVLGSALGLIGVTTIGWNRFSAVPRTMGLATAGALQAAAGLALMLGHGGDPNWYPVVAELNQPKYANTLIVFAKPKYEERFSHYADDFPYTAIALPELAGDDETASLSSLGDIHGDYDEALLISTDKAGDRPRNRRFLREMRELGFRDVSRRAIGRIVLIELHSDENGPRGETSTRP
jgi:4-amino-4-deoxy-L-arabinose transferase-like glycosyltransferase